MRTYLYAALLAFALSALLCYLAIPLLRRMGGQHILVYVREHEQKEGTPTMGGLAFILAACAAALLCVRGADKPFWVTLAVGLGYLVVGFLDDLLKKRRGSNLGLRAYQKVLFQLGVAVIASVYCCLEGMTVLRIPYTQLSFDIGWWMLPLGIFIFVATVNSVNLTDGLDGLAGGVSAVCFLSLSLLLAAQGADAALSLLCCSLTGALAAYLMFNTSRASVFMGDTGSLSLGGFAASAALFSGNALVIPILGLMFVLSSISVILQVIYYKKTGRRIFLMAPMHHHFQKKGYSEAKISYVYALTTALFGVTLFLPFA